MFLKTKTNGCIRQGEKKIIVRIESKGITRKGCLKQFQLVIGGARRHDATTIELGLNIG